MSEDVSKLVIQVQSDSVAQATDRLDRMSGASDKAEKSSESLVGAAHKLAAEYISLRAVWELGKRAIEDVTEATIESEGVQAKLRATTQASKADAMEMFRALDELEGKLAIPISELTTAYTELASRGLDPSRKALLAYADVAAGTGTRITDVTEAISQASNGMFRGLNQIGIRATQEIDGLALTFRGTTTKIKGDATSIEQYLQQLAKNNFMGAAETQADSLAGSIFKLKDAWGDMWRAVSEQGVGTLIHDAISFATDAVRELTDMIASGQMQGYIEAIIHKWDSFGNAFVDMVHFIKGAWSSTMEFFGTSSTEASNFLLDAFKNLPENVTAVVKGIGATLGLIVEYAIAVGKGAYDALVGQFKFIWETVKAVGQSIWDMIKNPTNAQEAVVSLYAAQEAAVKSLIDNTRSSITDTIQHIGFANDAWGEEITSIMNERDAALSGFKAKIDAADQLRHKYEELKAAREASGEDPLKKGQQKRGADMASEQLRAQFEQLKASLQLEEKTIQESYVKRLTLIRNMTKEGSAERRDLEQKLTAETTSAFEEANAKRLDDVIKLEADLREAEASGNIAKMASLHVQLQREEDAMKESYEYRRKLILDSTTLTEEQKQKKITELQLKQADMQRRIEIARNKATLDQAADFFGNLSTIAGAFGRKGANIAKAAAITQTLIKTYESATSAYAAMAGIPYIGPALGVTAAAAAVAAGLANVAQIRSQTYSGAYATGGSIPAGSWGWVGEAGPEPVFGPAVVTSARAAADRGGLTSTSNDKPTVVNVHNYAGAEVQVTERNTDDTKTIEILVQKVEENLASGIDRGGSKLSRTIERRYRLNRGNA